MESVSATAWTIFCLFVLLMLALDLGVFHRKVHVVSIREALTWSGIWIALAIAFNVLLLFWRGRQPALEFLTGYLIEKSLSVDNVFVFVTVFTYFRTPPELQHRVLFWGIVGALIMRAFLIAAGIAFLQSFHAGIYIFGGFLVFTGIRMVLDKGKEPTPDQNPVVRLFRKLMPVSDSYAGEQFFTRINGQRVATPLFLTLLLIETTDLIFAIDSIPAILAVTQDPFIVYTSNIFAMLGLRSLYFALAGIIHRFQYLHYGLAGILVFVGAKMLFSGLYKIPIPISLGTIGALLGGSMLLSLAAQRRLNGRN